jgi:hypothetical protein
MSREIVVVRCKRRHQVGTVTADADGLIVDYIGEVWHREDSTTGIFGAPSRVRLTDDESIDFAAYCRTCRKSVRLNTSVLRTAALDEHRRAISAPFTDTIDKAWTKPRGKKPLYPPGLTRFRDDPRKPNRD